MLIETGRRGALSLLLALSPRESMSAPLEAMRAAAREFSPFPLLAPLAFLSSAPSADVLRSAAESLRGGFRSGPFIRSGNWVFLSLEDGGSWPAVRNALGGLVVPGFLPSLPGILLGRGGIVPDAVPATGRLGAWTLDLFSFEYGPAGPLEGCSWEILGSAPIWKTASRTPNSP